jgi:hypothetical protein
MVLTPMSSRACRHGELCLMQCCTWMKKLPLRSGTLHSSWMSMRSCPLLRRLNLQQRTCCGVFACQMQLHRPRNVLAVHQNEWSRHAHLLWNLSSSFRDMWLPPSDLLPTLPILITHCGSDHTFCKPGPQTRCVGERNFTLRQTALGSLLVQCRRVAST